MRGRIALIGMLSSAFFLLILCRLIRLTVVEGEALARTAAAQHKQRLALTPRRGVILDRHGNLLALNIEVESLFIHPRKLLHNEEAASALASAAHLSLQEVEKVLHSSAPFVWLKRHANYTEAAAVRALHFDGVGSLKERKRVYPHGPLAAQVLGFAGVDLQGLEGIELFYDRYLKGEAHEVRAERDAWGRLIFSQGAAKVPQGVTVQLTIDKDLQYLAEQEIERAVATTQAKAGVVIILDPRSGEILALAQVPTFNPNNAGRFPPSARRNRAIADCFEPGSTLKAILAAAAIEEEAVHLEEQIFCEEGRYRIGRHTIHDHRPFGWLRFAEVIQQSSNIGVVKVGERLGKERYYAYLQRFGFGHPTGVDLPGEVPGILPPLSRRSRLTLATCSFGQGVAVTSLQLARAFAAIANGGFLLRPYIVQRVSDPAGRMLFLNHPTLVSQVIRAETARTLTSLLKGVVEKGTGRRARVEGFPVAGKTGTAHKAEQGRYSARGRIASFVGFVPADHPRLVILVVVDEPKIGTYGGEVATPVFQAIARQGLEQLGIRQADDGRRQTADGGRRTAVSGQLAGEVAHRQSLSSNHTEQNMSNTRAHSPDFLGMSLREAMVSASRWGCRVEVQGSGYVVNQEPLPDAEGSAGKHFRLTLQAEAVL